MHETTRSAVMANPASPGIEEAVRAPLAGLSLRGQRDEKRRRLVEMEYGLRAIELHLAAVEQELKSLEGFSLTGVLASLKGDRGVRIEEARRQVQDVQGKFEAAEAAIEALRREVEAIELRLAATGGTGAQPEHTVLSALPQTGEAMTPPTGGVEPAAQVPQTPAARIKAIQRAIDACEETRKGLLAEMETAGTLGRCNVAVVSGPLRALVNGARDRTRDMLGQRVRGDLRRFLGRYADAIAAGEPAMSEEEDVRLKLERAAEQFSGAWLQPNREASQATDDVLQTLALAEMLLEKRLNVTKT